MWKWATGLQLLIAGLCLVSSRSFAQQDSPSSDLLSGTARTLQRTAQGLSREALYAALVGQQLLPDTRNVVNGVIQATAGGLRQGAESIGAAPLADAVIAGVATTSRQLAVTGRDVTNSLMAAASPIVQPITQQAVSGARTIARGVGAFGAAVGIPPASEWLRDESRQVIRELAAAPITEQPSFAGKPLGDQDSLSDETELFGPSGASAGLSAPSKEEGAVQAEADDDETDDSISGTPPELSELPGGSGSTAPVQAPGIGDFFATPAAGDKRATSRAVGPISGQGSLGSVHANLQDNYIKEGALLARTFLGRNRAQSPMYHMHSGTTRHARKEGHSESHGRAAISQANDASHQPVGALGPALGSKHTLESPESAGMPIVRAPAILVLDSDGGLSLEALTASAPAAQASIALSHPASPNSVPKKGPIGGPHAPASAPALAGAPQTPGDLAAAASSSSPGNGQYTVASNLTPSPAPSRKVAASIASDDLNARTSNGATSATQHLSDSLSSEGPEEQADGQKWEPRSSLARSPSAPASAPPTISSAMGQLRAGFLIAPSLQPPLHLHTTPISMEGNADEPDASSILAPSLGKDASFVHGASGAPAPFTTEAPQQWVLNPLAALDTKGLPQSAKPLEDGRPTHIVGAPSMARGSRSQGWLAPPLSSLAPQVAEAQATGGPAPTGLASPGNAGRILMTDLAAPAASAAPGLSEMAAAVPAKAAQPPISLHDALQPTMTPAQIQHKNTATSSTDVGVPGGPSESIWEIPTRPFRLSDFRDVPAPAPISTTASWGSRADESLGSQRLAPASGPAFPQILAREFASGVALQPAGGPSTSLERTLTLMAAAPGPAGNSFDRPSVLVPTASEGALIYRGDGILPVGAPAPQALSLDLSADVVAPQLAPQPGFDFVHQDGTSSPAAAPAPDTASQGITALKGAALGPSESVPATGETREAMASDLLVPGPTAPLPYKAGTAPVQTNTTLLVTDTVVASTHLAPAPLQLAAPTLRADAALNNLAPSHLAAFAPKAEGPPSNVAHAVKHMPAFPPQVGNVPRDAPAELLRTPAETLSPSRAFTPTVQDSDSKHAVAPVLSNRPAEARLDVLKQVADVKGPSAPQVPMPHETGKDLPFEVAAATPDDEGAYRAESMSESGEDESDNEADAESSKFIARNEVAPAPAESEGQSLSQMLGAVASPHESPVIRRPQKVPDVSVLGISNASHHAQSLLPFFAGKPISEPDGDNAHGSVGATFPVYNLGQLRDLDGNQLDAVYKKGVADVPGDIPSEMKDFAYCDRAEVLMKSLSFPHGVLTAAAMPGSYELVNKLASPFLIGRVFHREPAAHTVHMWNLVLSDRNVQSMGTVSVQKGTAAKDGHPSVVVHHSDAQSIIEKATKDEFRRVGPRIWLGEATVGINMSSPLPTKSPNKMTQPLLDAMQALVDLASNTTSSAAKTVQHLADYLQVQFYYAFDCQSFYVPKLHYTPFSVESGQLGDNGAVGGANLDQVQPSGEEIKASEPYVLWPVRSNSTTVHNLFRPVPAAAFAQIFNASWAAIITKHQGRV
eukprot:jgi/Botrbrau1/19696/Bobra.0003s0057.1